MPHCIGSLSIKATKISVCITQVFNWIRMEMLLPSLTTLRVNMEMHHLRLHMGKRHHHRQSGYGTKNTNSTGTGTVSSGFGKVRAKEQYFELFRCLDYWVFGYLDVWMTGLYP